MLNADPLGAPPDYPPEVLVLAGSRPEAARLAPVATAMADQGRVEPVVVAGGSDPMRVHDAFEALGVPPEITLLLGAAPSSQVQVAAALSVRLDELIVERMPSAVLIAGGGVAPLVAAQVAFFRRIPVVHLYTGTDVDDLLCPFPEEGNRRVISQLSSLFLHTRGRGVLCNVAGPNSVAVGDTLAAITPVDPDLADLAARARAGDTRVGLLDASCPAILAATAPLLTRQTDVELVLVDLPDPHPGEDPVLDWLRGHPRVHAMDRLRLVDLMGAIAVLTFAATDRPHRQHEMLACGVPTLLVGEPESPADVLDPGCMVTVDPDPESLLAAMSRLLAGSSRGALDPAGTAAAHRVEHAVAWMLGLERDAVPSWDPASAR
ncbi:MAG: UDP-N-acetylglucosamine 2-epimerase [Pseudonocardia sp.]